MVFVAPYADPADQGAFPPGDYPLERPPVAGGHVAAVYRPVFYVLWRMFLASGRRRLVERDGQLVLTDGKGVVALVTANFDRECLARGVHGLGGVLCHRLVRWIIRWSHAHYRCGGRFNDHPPIVGGIGGDDGGLASRLGVERSSANAALLRALLEVMAAVAPEWFVGDSEPFLRTLTIRAGGNGVRGRLEIQPGRFANPNVVDIEGLRGRDRHLLPIQRAPFDSAEVSRLDLLLIDFVRERADKLVECGSVTLQRDDLVRIGKLAGMSMASLIEAMQSWNANVGRAVGVHHATMQLACVAVRDTPSGAFIFEAGAKMLHGRKRRGAEAKARRTESESSNPTLPPSASPPSSSEPPNADPRPTAAKP